MIFKILNNVKTSVELIEKHAQAKAFDELSAEIAKFHKAGFDAYTLAFELYDRYRAMKEKYDKTKDWKSETVPNYSLHEIASGVFVYVFDPVEKSKEPRHYLCPYCFDEQRKSILQRTGRDMSGVHMNCHKCGADFIDHTDRDAATVQTF